MELREALAMTTTTESQKLSPAMRQALRAFYFHTATSYTGGESGDVERLNEAGGTIHGSYRYWAGMRAATLEALKRRGLVATEYSPRSSYSNRRAQLTPAGHKAAMAELTDFERGQVTAFLMSQAMAEDLIRDQLADEVIRGVGDPNDASRTTERGRRWWVATRLLEGYGELNEELRKTDQVRDRDTVARLL